MNIKYNANQTVVLVPEVHYRAYVADTTDPNIALTLAYNDKLLPLANILLEEGIMSPTKTPWAIMQNDQEAIPYLLLTSGQWIQEDKYYGP